MNNKLLSIIPSGAGILFFAGIIFCFALETICFVGGVFDLPSWGDCLFVSVSLGEHDIKNKIIGNKRYLFILF
ncbi:hypothetical protein KAH27_04700, partial [bacterium]|nr:hypothetical protein [bacterium]